METYVDIFLDADGEKASNIEKKLVEIGLKSSMGDHDYVYDWKKTVAPSEIVIFADMVQSQLKGTGVLMKFITIR